MSATHSIEHSGSARSERLRRRWSLKVLVGSGDRIVLFALPFAIVGLGLNLWRPALFSVAGPPLWLFVLAVGMLIPGVIGWLWSVALVLSRVPRGELITHGPYALVKHPMYTSVALLVLPSLGLLFDSWLGVPLGLVLYVASRKYSPAEEKKLAQSFGPAWDAYCRRVMVPWL